MLLSNEQVERFRTIYREAYGEELPIEIARTEALRLVRLYALLASPTPSEQAARLAKKSDRATVKAGTQVERLNSSINS